ncbi:MAG: hypothetical protein A2X32_11345 [Elusimicrobia bacterium GWC2_64_44]|nr:MAG: hypothetical protein A2X32_11345 [Elusimicrobia bacterium GWC2_64_44]
MTFPGSRVKEFFFGISRERAALIALSLLGLAARIGYILWTRDAAPHPDLGSFLPSSLAFTHPFDTSPREPLFVWWLWLLGKLGAGSAAGIRLAGSLWFLPSFFLFFALAARFLGAGRAWAAAALYAFLPAQVQSDSLGLRNLQETFALLLLLNALHAPAGPKAWRLPAAALALLALTRVNYVLSGFLLLAAAAWRARGLRPLLALAPALLLLAPHLQNNKARHGDPLYSVSLHASYISNMENLGRPGFPATVYEWQKDPYAQRLTTRQWLFENHTPWELARDSAKGLRSGLWDFYWKVYFSLGLPGRAAVLLLGLYLLGAALAALTPGLRLLPLWLLLLTLPYAFTSHVFWAGRFFTPFAPLALLLAVLGGGRAWDTLRGLRPRPRTAPKL